MAVSKKARRRVHTDRSETEISAHLSEVETVALDAVRHVQIMRLRKEYKDFLESPIYSRITTYFFDQIYGAGDKAKRDAAFNKIYDKLSAAVSEKRIMRVSQLKQLNELTDELDIALARIYLKDFTPRKMTQEVYEKCYKKLGEKEKRIHQIYLLLETTRFFHKLAHIPLLGFVIKPTQLAAKALGVEYIMDFFMEGYRCFKSVKNSEPFLEAVHSRETAYMNKILSNS